MKIDTHTHVFAPEVVQQRDRLFARDPYFRQLYEHPRSRLATAEDLLAELDRSGFDRRGRLRLGLDRPRALRRAERLPDRRRATVPRTALLGFAAVQPTAGAAAVREAERAIRAGLRGIGELMPHGQGFALDQTDLLAPLAELAVALDVPILTHTSEPVGHVYPGKGEVTLQTVLHLAASQPELKLICAHWGGGLPFYELMPEVAAAAANLWYDTAASPYLYDPRVYAAVRALIGADRILFGTDFPLLRIDRCARQVRESGLPADEVDAILGGNAARLLLGDTAPR